MAELMFIMEESPSAPSADAPAVHDNLSKAHMDYLLRPRSSYQQQVLQDAKQVYAQRAALGVPQCDAAAMATELAARGHLAKLRRARGGGEFPAAFRNLSHSFAVVGVSPQLLNCQLDPAAEGAGGGRAQTEPASCCAAQLDCGICHGGCSTEFIVELNLGSHFVVPRSSPRYQGLVDLLPAIFVGPACQLEHVVDWMCREMYWSFRQQGESLPPWRRKDCMLSKWLPKVAEDTIAHLHGLPASPTTPSAVPGPLATAPPAALSSSVGAVRTSGGSDERHGGAKLGLALQLGAIPAPQGDRRVIRVPFVSCPSQAAAAALAGEDGEWGIGGGSPDSPSLSWEGCGSASPLSVLQTALPFARTGGAGGEGHGCCGSAVAAQRSRGSASLLTRQLALTRRQQLEI